MRSFRGRRAAAHVLAGVFALTALCAGLRLAGSRREEAQEEAAFRSLAARTEEAEAEKESDPVPSAAQDAPPRELFRPPALPAFKGSDDDAEAEAAILPQYAALYEENPDLAGWLRIDGTAIDYPVMHTPDEPEYYLRRDFYGEDSRSGTPFLDGACTLSPDSDNLIVYGHNMRNGAMFSELESYCSYDFWLSHPTVKFDTLTEQREYRVFAVFRSTVLRTDEEGFRYYQFRYAETEAEFDEFVANVKALSLYDTGITPQYGDGLLTLSTCSYHAENGRLAVVAVRIK